MVNIFRNKTKIWLHIFIDNQEIICTPEHPFYIKHKGWIKAKNLVESDECILYNKSSARIEKIEVEVLEQEEVTFNFEVEDDHTYFVTNSNILVHNDCILETEHKESQTEIIGKAHGSPEHQAEIYRQVESLVETGDYSKIYLNRSLSTTGVLDKNYLRPDIIALRKDGKFYLIEVASKTQVEGTTAFSLLQEHVDFYKTLSNVYKADLIQWGTF